MDNQYKVRFFLGANTGDGFHSLYDGFVDCAGGDFLWVIKGGPGCGKSNFMMHIVQAAENAGLEVEYILCASDPDSLDGIYLPKLRTAYVDGTAPHVLDSPLPGAGSLYLDLGAFYDSEALIPWLGEIAELFANYQALYARSYDLLAAAARVTPERLPNLRRSELLHSVRRRAERIAARELGQRRGGGTFKRRFLSANTCSGHIFLWETVAAMCERVFTLDNELGLAPVFLDTILEAAAERNLDVVLCPNSLCPEIPEALLLPACSLGFVAVSPGHEYGGHVSRHIRLDAMADREAFRELRPEFRRCARLRNELMRAAADSLAGAKALYDGLETIYANHVDYGGIFALAEEHVDYLLGQIES